MDSTTPAGSSRSNASPVGTAGAGTGATAGAGSAAGAGAAATSVDSLGPQAASRTQAATTMKTLFTGDPSLQWNGEWLRAARAHPRVDGGAGGAEIRAPKRAQGASGAAVYQLHGGRSTAAP